MTEPFTDDAGNAAQIRRIVMQAMEIKAELEPKPMELPPVFKWLAGIAAVVMAGIVLGFGTWLVSTVSDMQVTLARMDERQVSQVDTVDSRFGDMERRVGRLEAYHAGGGK